MRLRNAGMGRGGARVCDGPATALRWATAAIVEECKSARIGGDAERTGGKPSEAAACGARCRVARARLGSRACVVEQHRHLPRLAGFLPHTTTSTVVLAPVHMLRTVLCRRAALAAAHRPAGRTLPAVPALAERANVAPRTQPSRTRALSSTPAARLASTAATASGSGSGGKASAVAAAQDASLRVEVPTQAAGTVGDLLKSE
jgi:hypothetical protein